MDLVPFNFGSTSKVGILLIVFLTLGCTVRQIDKARHEKEVTPPVFVELEVTPASGSKLEAVNLEKIEKKIAAAKTPIELLSVVKELGEFITNKNYIENPKYSNSIKLKTLLGHYNQALLSLYEVSPETVKMEKLFEQYLLVVKSGCNEQIDRCLNFSFFSSDFRSAIVIRSMALILDSKIDSSKTEKEGTKKCLSEECFKSISEYYDLIRLCHILKNRNKDDEVDFMYMKRARDYVDYFNSLPMNSRDGEAIRRHVAKFENIISNYSANPNDPKFREFIVNFKPWTYSKLEADPFPFGTQKMFSYAASNFLYENKNGNKALSSDFIQALKISQVAGDSFFSNVRALNPTMLGSFSLDPKKIEEPTFLNEYFFIIDRLYRGHLNVEEVSQIWMGSERSEDKLYSVLEYYLKMEVLKMVVKTSTDMSVKYADKNINTQSLIYDTIQKSKEISDRWTDVLVRFDRIALFLGRNIKKQGEIQKKYDEKMRMFDSLRRNIKYISAYPNKMMMVYYSALHESSFEINTYFGQIKVDPNTVIKLFFGGELPPWLRFVNTDPTALNKIELIYAFYFTLATNIFEIYGSEEMSTAAVDYKKFFSLVMKQYLYEEKTRVETELREFRKFISGSSEYGSFLRICASKDRRVPIVGGISSLQYYAYVGGGKFGISAFAQKIYSSDIEIGLRRIRTDFESKIRPIRTMVDILKNNNSGVEQQSKREALSYIDSELNQIEELKRSYYREVVDQHRLVSKCLRELTDFERERERVIIGEEIEFLKAVYNSMLLLKGLQGDALNKKIAEIHRSFNFQKNLDVVSPTEFKYSQLGLYLRLYDKMSKMKPGIDIEINEEFLTRLDSYKEKKAIKFVEDDGTYVKPEVFVANAMKLWNGVDKSAYINWTEVNHSLSPQEEKITTLIELYKLGRDLGLPPEQLIQPQEIIEEVFQLHKLINITAEDAIMLKQLSLSSKVQRKEINDKLFNSNTGYTVGLLDWFFLRIANDQEALLDAQQFSKTVSSWGYFLFAPNPKIDQIMRDNYRPIVLRYEAGINSFKAAVSELETKYSSQNLENLKIIYALRSDGSPEIYQPDLNVQGHPFLISDNKRKNVESAIFNFHWKETGEYYLKKLGDPECKDKTILSCQEKLKK
ncbi:MAG: hypothetical protein A4S09_05130 [Proteobacteria bacterium SG_bin7]|nr:MAG: hypothetical protein A4S09_05130 [Proteobacteria bacterium SG_bin7]